MFEIFPHSAHAQIQSTVKILKNAEKNRTKREKIAAKATKFARDIN